MQHGIVNKALINNIYPIRYKWKVEPYLLVSTKSGQYFKLKYEEIIKLLMQADLEVVQPRKHYYLRVKEKNDAATENQSI